MFSVVQNPAWLLFALSVTPSFSRNPTETERAVKFRDEGLKHYLEEVAARPAEKSTTPADPPCHKCDASTVHVPSEITWVSNTDPYAVDELNMFGDIKDPDKVWNYWDRLASASESSKGRRSSKPLQEACALTGVREAISRIAASKGEGEGVHLHFRGDSHSRVTFVATVRSLVRDAKSFFDVNYGLSVMQSDHVFCCAGRDLKDNSFYDCVSESGPSVDPRSIRYKKQRLTADVVDSGNFTSLRNHTKLKVEAGQVCLSWENRDRFMDDSEFHGGNWLKLFSDIGHGPDIVFANGGNHYSRIDELDPKPWGDEFGRWMLESANALEQSPALAKTRFVLSASPPNGYVPWLAQAVTFEIMRAEVVSLARTHPRTFARSSYLDFHTLVGASACGLATRFPNYAYFVKVNIVACLRYIFAP